jgi:hypothetical protein
MAELNHEPETKGTNKARDLQDAMIRARRAGCEDALSVANYIYDRWFIDASRDAQITVLHYAVQHQWTNVEKKIKPRRNVSASTRARIEADEKEKIIRLWLDTIMSMTGRQLRAVDSLSAEMKAQVGDDQRVGDVFTVAELRAVFLAGK